VKFTRLYRVNDGRQQRSGNDSTQIIRREFKNRGATPAEVLLITDILIGRDQKIEMSFCQPQEFTVVDAWRFPMNTNEYFRIRSNACNYLRVVRLATSRYTWKFLRQKQGAASA
jgi:hypothetical protein